MTPLRVISLTGADEAIDVDALLALSESNRLVEWGILYSSARQAEEHGQGRYPRTQWIEELLVATEERPVKLALHLCGQDAVEFVRGNGALVELVERFGRVQLNVRADGSNFAPGLSTGDLERAVQRTVRSELRTRVILQRNLANEALYQATRRIDGLEFLNDASCGRGVTPGAWQSQAERDGTCQGYAGGLGPETIAAALPAIVRASAERPFWLDMESALRDASDRFQLDRCSAVLETVNDFLVEDAGQRLALSAAHRSVAGESVAELGGFWLDWFAGAAAGLRMVAPPDDAVRAVCLLPHEGKFFGFAPSESATDLEYLLRDLDVGAVKRDGGWHASSPNGAELYGATRSEAMIRCVIADAFGPSLPVNPALSAPFLRAWMGTSGDRYCRSVRSFAPRP
ncbi:hypothetical protein ACSFA0_23575 [Variovorax sp. LT1P1]|uniref:hypothetical protein n=1 Tax=Variovorax sp. LT1P1 TaxID=3443730 RepID=UPI003F44FB85